MKQNIYDNPDFFRAYKAIRDDQLGLNELLEEPALWSLLPDPKGLRALDLGCGAGRLSRRLREGGAASVVGVDISERMLELARTEAGEGVELRRCAVEDFEAPDGSFDLVVSSLMLHYVADFAGAVRKVARWLAPGGHFVFSIEHPMTTASLGMRPGWARDARGERLHWAVDCYQDEGRRESRWLVERVVKYHRALATVLNDVIDSGLALRRVLEPHAPEWAEKERPKLLEERRRPPFLMVRAQKPPPL